MHCIHYIEYERSFHMKKNSMLALACAFVLVGVTSTSYALWDQLESSKSTNITFTRMMVQAQDVTLSKTSTLEDGTPVYSGTFTVDVSGVNDLSTKQLSLTPELKKGETDVLSNVEVKFAQADDTLATADNVTTDKALEASNAYTLTITPKNDEESVKALTDGDGNVTVTLTAKLADQAN